MFPVLHTQYELGFGLALPPELFGADSQISLTTFDPGHVATNLFAQQCLFSVHVTGQYVSSISHDAGPEGPEMADHGKLISIYQNVYVNSSPIFDILT